MPRRPSSRSTAPRGLAAPRSRGHGTDTVEGDFDVVRWRIGVGYAYPSSPTMAFYGRLSFDDAELKDVQVPGDSDTLIGLNGRWYFRPDIALVTGYEYGKITTWNVGVRFSF